MAAPGALSHVCPGPEVLRCPLNSLKVPLISAQGGMCPWSRCWLSGGYSHPRFCGESAVGQCQEAAEEAAVDAKHTTNRIPAFIQEKDTVLPVMAGPTSTCFTVPRG